MAAITVSDGPASMAAVGMSDVAARVGAVALTSAAEATADSFAVLVGCTMTSLSVQEIRRLVFRPISFQDAFMLELQYDLLHALML